MRLRVLICVTAVTLLFANTGYSQTTTAYGLTFPNAHPRLFWTPARITTAKAWVTSTGYLGQTANTRNLDDYDIAFTCINGPPSAQAAACAQAITDTTGFAPSSGCYTGPGCDAMRVQGEMMLLIRDWLAPGCGLAACLTAGQVTTLETNWNTWQNGQDTVTQTWGNVGMPASNYFAGQFRNDFTFGIASYITNASADANLQYAMNSRWVDLLNFDSPTGTGRNGAYGYAFHNQEGAAEYGRYSLDYYAAALASSALLGRDLWNETTAFKSGVLTTIYNTVLQRTASPRSVWDGFTASDDEQWVAADTCAFQSHNSTGNANATGGCMMESQYYGDFMTAAAGEYAATNIGKYARQWLGTVKPAVGPMFRSVDPGGSSLAFSNLPLDYYASGANYLYLHDTWTSTGTTCLLQMGVTKGTNPGAQAWGSGHSHWDAGTFQCSRKGVNIIRETMGYSETVAGYGGACLSGGCANVYEGFAHNIPFVGGQAQNISQGCSDGPGIIKRLESQTNYAYAVTDLTLVYQNHVCDAGNPTRQNQNVVSVVREYLYFRGINVLLVVDRIQTTASGTSTTFVTHCETSPSVSGAQVTCNDGTQRALYTALLPTAPTISTFAENVSSSGPTPVIATGEWQYRIESNNTNPGNVVSYQVNAIQLGDISGFVALTPSIVDNGTNWTVTLDANDVATIFKGTASTGGTVKAAGATTTLATTVESMTITDAGPVWGTVPPPNAPVVSLNPTSLSFGAVNVGKVSAA